MMDTESTNQPAVLVARCDNYREDVDQACHGEIRFRWGMSQSDPCDTCGARCGIAVAAWERVELAAAVPDTGQAPDVAEPIDWLARFRAAADVADARGWPGTARSLWDLASQLSVYVVSAEAPQPRHDPAAAEIAEAIGRALLGTDITPEAGQ